MSATERHAPMATRRNDRQTLGRVQKRSISVPGSERPRTRTCEQCGQRFGPRAHNQRYCSKACWRKHRRVERLKQPMILTDRRCALCGSRMPETMRATAKFCSARCRREAFAQKPCVYCGEVANSRDHFIPRAFQQRIEQLGWAKKGRLIVPACIECNSTAGSKVFRTITEKRAYIHGQYRRKYRKLLEAPVWTNEEIAELGPVLRSHVVAATQAVEIVKARLRWPRVAP